MQLLKLWKTATSHGCKDEAQHDGKEHLVGVDAGHVPEKDPRLSFPAWVQHIVQGHELQERRRGGPAVLRCGVLTARVLPACTICTSISMQKATVNVVAFSCIALGLVDVDAVCADSV